MMGWDSKTPLIWNESIREHRSYEACVMLFSVCVISQLSFLYCSTSDSCPALALSTYASGFYSLHTWPDFGLQTCRENDREEVQSGEKPPAKIITYPLFMTEIKLPDLIKLCDVFVKLEHVFDVWWKEMEISSDSVILECLNRSWLILQPMLNLIKDTQILNFDWAIDIADCWCGKIMDFLLNLSLDLSFSVDTVDI